MVCPDEKEAREHTCSKIEGETPVHVETFLQPAQSQRLSRERVSNCAGSLFLIITK